MGRDLRKYRNQTTFRLIAGALGLLFIVGGALIYFIYGPQSAITALLCLSGSMLPVIGVIIALKFIDWVVRKANEKSE
jgi:hypothetical protein